MFTGIVEETGELVAFRAPPARPGGWSRRPRGAQDLAVGDSIAVNGCCLTATRAGPASLHFDLLEETRRLTSFSQLKAGARVNLELSLRLGGKMGGHFVTGRIDAVGLIGGRAAPTRTTTCACPCRALLARVSKGSIAIDGVSLTVAEAGPDSLAVWLIRCAVTALGDKRAGDQVNLEFDLLGKYVEKLLPAAPADPPPRPHRAHRGAPPAPVRRRQAGQCLRRGAGRPPGRGAGRGRRRPRFRAAPVPAAVPAARSARPAPVAVAARPSVPAGPPPALPGSARPPAAPWRARRRLGRLWGRSCGGTRIAARISARARQLVVGVGDDSNARVFFRGRGPGRRGGGAGGALCRARRPAPEQDDRRDGPRAPPGLYRQHHELAPGDAGRRRRRPVRQSSRPPPRSWPPASRTSWRRSRSSTRRSSSRSGPPRARGSSGWAPSRPWGRSAAAGTTSRASP